MTWLSFASASLALSASFAPTHAAQNVVRGVNLGGWLVTEPWITPSLYSSTNTKDEWHLTNVLGKDQALQTMQAHWSSFYSRDDFVQMKAAVRHHCSYTTGSPLTFTDSVRIPLGYWAVDLLDYEPYVSGQYPYLIQAVQWAKEMDFTVLIDLHGAPGSQNGWEETGLIGPIDFIANASNSDRSLNVLKNLTEEFTKPVYGGVVTNIELLNEPIFQDSLLREFYTAGANVVGVANSSGINITIHDAFYNPPTWENYNPWDASAKEPAQHVTLDTHQFWGFPPLNDMTKTQILDAICAFAGTVKVTDMGILPFVVGEWSLDTGVTSNSTTDSATDQAKRTWFRTLFEAQNAAYSPTAAGQPSIGWYYWAWQTEYDIDAWSFRKGIAQGYIPSNVSDQSTYHFPILENGCINASFPYEAAASVSASASASATASSGSSPSATGTPAKKSGASTLHVSILFMMVPALVAIFFL